MEDKNELSVDTNNEEVKEKEINEENIIVEDIEELANSEENSENVIEEDSTVIEETVIEEEIEDSITGTITNSERITNKETITSKKKGQGPLYWVIVVVGVAFIVYMGIQIGKKLENVVNPDTSVEKSNKDSNLDNSKSNINTDSNSNSNELNSNVQTNTNSNTNQSNSNSNVKNNTTTKQEMIKVQLPSGETISVNKVFKEMFMGMQQVNLNMKGIDSNSPNAYLLLSDLIKKEIDNYNQTEGAQCSYNNVKISSSQFDFDKDGINEILFSLCDENRYALIHYDSKEDMIYSYDLAGYRSNGSWRVNGTSRASNSAFDNYVYQYSFNDAKLASTVIAYTMGEFTGSDDEDVKMTYIIGNKKVTKDEYSKFLKDQEKYALIEYVDYR